MPTLEEFNAGIQKGMQSEQFQRGLDIMSGADPTEAAFKRAQTQVLQAEAAEAQRALQMQNLSPQLITAIRGMNPEKAFDVLTSAGLSRDVAISTIKDAHGLRELGSLDETYIPDPAGSGNVIGINNRTGEKRIVSGQEVAKMQGAGGTEKVGLPPLSGADGRIEAPNAPAGGADLSGVSPKTRQEIELKRAQDVDERAAEMPKAQNRMVAALAEMDDSIAKIDEILPSIDEWSAGKGSLLSILPSTDARQLEADLTPLTARAAFGSLQEMRDNSKTGGALGAISERELSLLGGKQESLDQGQKPENFKKKLKDYRAALVASKGRLKSAYKRDYGVEFDASSYTDLSGISTAELEAMLEAEE